MVLSLDAFLPRASQMLGPENVLLEACINSGSPMKESQDDLLGQSYPNRWYSAGDVRRLSVWRKLHQVSWTCFSRPISDDVQLSEEFWKS